MASSLPKKLRRRNPVRIGWFLSRMGEERGYERVVSGHVQVPLHSANLFLAAGHEVEIITTRFSPTDTAPDCLPPGVPLHFVEDGRKRGKGPGEPSRGVDAVNLYRQARQILRVAHERKFDVLHFCAQSATAQFAGLLKWIGLRPPVVVSFQQPEMAVAPGWLARPLWNRLDAVLVTTEHARQMCARAEIEADRISHGIVFDPQDQPGWNPSSAPRRVLFWRDPSVRNGADIALAVYDRLAPEFPDIDFDMAVRPYWKPVAGLDDLAARHANVHVYRFPYAEGISIPGLLSESLCVLMPFRQQSLDPQLSIMESMAAGVPVISTDMGSIPEFIVSRRNGMLIPRGDVDAAVEAVRYCLANPERARGMGRVARQDLLDHWNWERWVDELGDVYRRVVESRPQADRPARGEGPG